MKNIIRWPIITFFSFTFLLLAGPYVQIGKVYSQQEDQEQGVCTPEQEQAGVCIAEDEPANLCTTEDQSGGVCTPDEFTATCGPGVTDDAVEQRCNPVIMEKYLYLLSNEEHLTRVFMKTNGEFCNPLAENCDVKYRPNFSGCTRLITDDSLVCSKNWLAKPYPNGKINNPPRWEEPPSYDSLFPPKANQPRSLCTYSEIKQGFDAGKKVGHYVGITIEIAHEGVVTAMSQEIGGVPTPIGVVSKYGIGAAGAGLGGVFCGIQKLGNAYDKIKAYLGNEEEKKMAKLKLETKKWCYGYDYQEGIRCALLIDRYYDCLAKQPRFTSSQGIRMFFIEGYLNVGKDPCWWKKDGPMPIPERPAYGENLLPQKSPEPIQ